MITLNRRKFSILKLVAIALIGVLLLAACQSATQSPTPTKALPSATPPPPTATSVPPTPTEEMITPAVSVLDQEIVDSSVVVPLVVSDAQGWIVIHTDNEGAPGPVIGFAGVAQGENTEVVVEIDTAGATETLYAMLHVDAGTAGEYEFPGDDVPVSVEGQVVLAPFAITGGLVVEPSISVVDQDIAEGSIHIAEAASDGPGWVVIHTQMDGAPGPVIGYAALEHGLNQDIAVDVDPATATETLYAMLHVDAGAVGEYEFPGEDAPAKADDQVVVIPFKVTGLPPSVIVMDQSFDEDSVTIRQAVSQGPGWIVIHTDNQGSPGPVIGFAPLTDGINVDVRVEVDESDSTETLFAMLHVDAGTAGEYEFPGDDVPVMVDDQVVMTPFKVSMSSSEGAVVSLIDNEFKPNQLTVKAGTTVVFTNTGNRTHTVTSDNGLFNSGRLSSGATFEFTFTDPGEYPFYCEPHGDPGGEGMSGVIIVTAGE